MRLPSSSAVGLIAASLLGCLACSHEWEAVWEDARPLWASGGDAGMMIVAAGGTGGVEPVTPLGGRTAPHSGGVPSGGGEGGEAPALFDCPGNLVQDGGFEEGRSGAPLQWVVEQLDGDRGIAEVRTGSASSGGYALWLDTSKAVPASSTTYRLRLGTALEPLPAAGSLLEGTLAAQLTHADTTAPELWIEYQDEGGLVIAATAPIAIAPSQGFRRVVIAATRIPEGASSARLRLALPRGVTGHLDDVCLGLGEE